MNAVGTATLIITLLGWLSGMVVGSIIIVHLANRRWLSALKWFAALTVIAFVTAEAASLGVGQWNKAIAARAARAT